MRLFGHQEYVKWCFSEQLKNIMIYDLNSSKFEFTVTTFREKVLKIVSFFGVDVSSENHPKTIDEIVKVAQMVEFSCSSSPGDVHQALQYCTNMKHLVLKTFTECKTHSHDNPWLFQKHCQRLPTSSDLRRCPKEWSDYLSEKNPKPPKMLPFIIETNWILLFIQTHTIYVSARDQTHEMHITKILSLAHSWIIVRIKRERPRIIRFFYLLFISFSKFAWILITFTHFSTDLKKPSNRKRNKI